MARYVLLIPSLDDRNLSWPENPIEPVL